MNTPPAAPVVPSHPDWLNDCSFQSRQESPGLTPGILNHQVKKATSPTSFHHSFISPGVTDLGAQGLVPVTRADSPAITSKLPNARNNELLSEVRTLRQLSAGVFDPHASRDFLPDLILFAVIGTLCAAWPIISMFSVMASRH
jgi:hypothetical protein